MERKNNEERLPFRKLLKEMSTQSRSMRSRLMMYMCSLVLAGSGVLLLMLIATGVFSAGGIGIEQSLKVQLQSRKSDMKAKLDVFAGNGIDLSKKISSALEQSILTYPYDIHDLEDDKEKLEEMQLNIYPLLESELKVTRASGVFAVFDATVNSNAPGAENSRSGLYLRLANVSSSSAPENDIFLFRGNPNVAMQKQIQIHNRWNMEFNTELLDWYRTQLFNGKTKEKSEDYLWIERHSLDGTWENSIFLSVPVVGNSDSCYGLCGLEFSSLLFRLCYPVVESKYGDMVTVFAPLDKEHLLVQYGLIGEQGNVYINDSEELSIETEKGFNIYKNGKKRYIGIHQPIRGAKDSCGRQWVIAVLFSYDSYNAYAGNEKLLLITILSIFILIMLLNSYVISRRFVMPIEQSIENLKADNFHERQIKSGITEIDLLAEFLKNKEERYRQDGRSEPALPPDIEELFNRFIERSKTLTASERNILNYYIEEHEIADIPALACISINTVRKHNRSIYEKLGVNSKDELQLYLDLLRRCERIDELS